MHLDTANTLRNIIGTINNGIKEGNKDNVADELLIISKLKYDNESANIMNDYLTLYKNDIINFLGTKLKDKKDLIERLNATKENITEGKKVNLETEQADVLKEKN